VAREFELYRTHEELFRHVFRNDNVDPSSLAQRMQHLAARAMQVIDLEDKLNAATATDFREAYVAHAVKTLFGTSIDDLLGSIGQGVVLEMPQDNLAPYAAERKLDPATVGNETRKRVLHATNHYGILTLYLEQTLDERQKRQLIDTIERTIGLNHQQMQPQLNFGKHSKYTLTELKDGNGDLFDFIISFSPYDPMTVPRMDSRVHTLAFASLTQSHAGEGTTKLSIPIEPVSIEDAKKFVEGNGSS
jgi:hypothetical protein